MTDVKSWLNRYRDDVSYSDLLRERLEVSKTLSAEPQHHTLDGMPHSSEISDRTATSATRTVILENEFHAAAEKAQQSFNEIEAVLNAIPIKRQKEKNAVIVLECRYLDLMPWSAILAVLYGNKDDFEDRVESYKRALFRVHGLGLELVQKALAQ